MKRHSIADRWTLTREQVAARVHVRRRRFVQPPQLSGTHVTRDGKEGLGLWGERGRTLAYWYNLSQRASHSENTYISNI